MRVCIFVGVKQKESVAVLWSDRVWKIYWVAEVKKKNKKQPESLQRRSACKFLLVCLFVR